MPRLPLAQRQCRFDIQEKVVQAALHDADKYIFDHLVRLFTSLHCCELNLGRELSLT